MSDVSEIAFPHFPAGHRDEKTVLTFDYLYVVNNKFIVECDRDNGLHFSLVVDFPNPDISYVHIIDHLSCPFPVVDKYII